MGVIVNTCAVYKNACTHLLSRQEATNALCTLLAIFSSLSKKSQRGISEPGYSAVPRLTASTKSPRSKDALQFASLLLFFKPVASHID